MSTKQAPRNASGDSNAGSASLARQVGQERKRATQAGQAKRESLKKLEARLTEQLQFLSEELAREQAASAQRELALSQRAETLNEQAAELSLLREDLQERAQLWEHAQTEAGSRQQELLEELRCEHEKLGRRREELEAVAQSVAQRKQDLERREQETQLRQNEFAQREAELTALAKRHAATREQRRRLAKELRAQRAQMLAEVERQRAELLQVTTGEDSQLHRQIIEQTVALNQARAEQEELRKHISAGREQLDSRKEEIKACHEELAARKAEIKACSEELAIREEELESRNKLIAARDEEIAALRRQLVSAESQAGKDTSANEVELTQLRSERAELQELLTTTEADLEEQKSLRHRVQARLTEAEQQLATAEKQLTDKPAEEGIDNQQFADLRRRFEMAVQDVREFKNQNAELKKELEAARRSKGSGGSANQAIVGGDWESQKKRLMQQLEEDFDDGSSEEVEDRLTVEGAIRITDSMVAEKEREIQELKRLLDDQSSNIGGLAVGATAIAAVLDQDELIREERENLKRAQDEWRAKLRQAEVDISLERAKLARERAEVEEKVRQLAAASKEEAEGAPANGDKSKKPRRWLSLLVKDSES